MKPSPAERIERVTVAALVVALVVWSAHQRWVILTESPMPLGVDGFFYPIQIRALLETGMLAYPSSPLTFWFMLPFAAATDPIVGAKLGAAIGGALVALPAYALGARLARSRGAGLVAAALATASASSAYLSIEFVKQGIGITVALAAIVIVLRATDRPTHVRIACAIAGVIATLLAHKLAAALVVLVGVPAALEAARARGRLRGRRLLYLTTGVIAIVVIALIIGLAAPQRFASPRDLALLGDLVSATAHWDAPALVMPRNSLVFDHEALVALVAALLAACALLSRSGVGLTRHAPWEPRLVWWIVLSVPIAVIKLLRTLGAEAPPPSPEAPRAEADRVAAWILVGLGVVIGLPWLAVVDPQGLGFRLRLAAYVPLSLCAAVVIPLLVAPLQSRAALGVCAAFAAIVVLRANGEPRTEGRVLAHPALVSAVAASTRYIPPGSTVIVPERHILFMVVWFTRTEASLRPDAVSREHRIRMLPLAFTGMDSPLDRALDAARTTPGVAPPIGLHARHRNGLVLVSEPTWDWLIARVGATSYWATWPTI